VFHVSRFKLRVWGFRGVRVQSAVLKFQGVGPKPRDCYSTKNSPYVEPLRTRKQSYMRVTESYMSVMSRMRELLGRI
jgi:hypothetical protein